MSLFLGKIHYWLFNKILWFEKLEDEIIDLAKKEGFEVEKISQDIQNKYGRKLPNKPLEDLIDTGNIHGWLQGQIHSAERRMAAWTKLLIEADEKNYKKLEEVYKIQGIVAAKEIKAEGNAPSTPEALFNSMNDYILDGMPCDRVNVILEHDENHLKYQQSIEIHDKFLSQADADIKDYYLLRNKIIEGMLSKCGLTFSVFNNEIYEIKVS